MQTESCFHYFIITGHHLIDSFIVGFGSVILFAIYPFYVDSTARYADNPGVENLIFIIIGTALGTAIGDFTTYILVKAFRNWTDGHPNNRISQFLAPRVDKIDQLNPKKGSRIFLFAFLSGSLPLNDHVIMSAQGFTKQNRNYVFSGLLIGKFVLAIWIIGIGNVLLSLTDQKVNASVYWIAAGLTIGMIVIMWKTKDMTMAGFSILTFDLLVVAAIALLVSYDVSFENANLSSPKGELIFVVSCLLVLTIFLLSVLSVYRHKFKTLQTWRNITTITFSTLGIFVWYGSQTIYRSMTTLLWGFAFLMILSGALALITEFFILQKKRKSSHNAELDKY